MNETTNKEWGKSAEVPIEKGYEEFVAKKWACINYLATLEDAIMNLNPNLLTEDKIDAVMNADEAVILAVKQLKEATDGYWELIINDLNESQSKEGNKI